MADECMMHRTKIKISYSHVINTGVAMHEKVVLLSISNGYMLPIFWFEVQDTSVRCTVNVSPSQLMRGVEYIGMIYRAYNEIEKCLDNQNRPLH